MKKTKLFVGPFVGELGWELFCWQGIIRKLSKEFDTTTVICKNGHSGLYKDFADEIIEYTPESYIPNEYYNVGITQNYPLPDNTVTKYIGPNERVTGYSANNPVEFINNKQHFIKLGSNDSPIEGYDFLIHARYTNKMATAERNWDIDNWSQITKWLESNNYTFACIGSPNGSLAVPGAKDLRGIPLIDLTDIMRQSTHIIGPSSGPIHLGALCDMKVIVWSGADYNDIRYNIHWNPHLVDVISDHTNWNPTVAMVKSMVSKSLKLKEILVVLVNYGDDQIQYLEQVVKELKSFKKYEVSIIVNSNIPLDIEGVNQVNVIELSDYQLLPLTCRQVIWDHKDDFDLFLFGENDHLFKEHHIDRHLEYLKIIPDSRITGLIQYEENETSRYYPAYHAHYEWDFNSVEEYGGKQFAHFSNIHQATFILNKEQLHKIGHLHDFNHFFGPSNYSVKCKVNTDIYQFCGMKKIICISDFEDNLIHHLPNIYINGDRNRAKQNSPEHRMQESLNRLLK